MLRNKLQNISLKNNTKSNTYYSHRRCCSNFVNCNDSRKSLNYNENDSINSIFCESIKRSQLDTLGVNAKKRPINDTYLRKFELNKLTKNLKKCVSKDCINIRIQQIMHERQRSVLCINTDKDGTISKINNTPTKSINLKFFRRKNSVEFTKLSKDDIFNKLHKVPIDNIKNYHEVFDKFKKSNYRRNQYYIKAEKLINEFRQPDTSDNYSSTKKRCIDNVSNNMNWAIKMYLANLCGNNWKRSDNIDYLISIREKTKTMEKNLYNLESMNKLHRDAIRRMLVMPSFRKRKIWKPAKYLPSKSIDISNIMNG